MTPYLFVYGTLMSTASGGLGGGERERLAKTATLVAPAAFQGRLFDLGNYPGAIDTPDGEAAVAGEVWKFKAKEPDFAWLDDYEGVDPETGAGSEYVRTRREVTLPDGQKLEAWIYLCTIDVSAHQRVESGSWLKRS